MVFKKSSLLFFGFVLVISQKSLWAQEVSVATERQMSVVEVAELTKWMKDDAKYLSWYKVKGNKVLVKHRLRPEPPVWLSASCKETVFQDLLISACELLREITDGPVASKIRSATLASRVQKEAPTKTRFFERVHFGGGWPIVDDYRDVKYMAVIETHVSIADVGRVEINLPGIMFLSVPDTYGRRNIRQATHVGIGWRLKTFQIPSVSQKFVLHLNIAHAWPMGGVKFASQRPVSLAGFSVTLKK